MCFQEEKSQKILIYWSIHIIDPVRPIWITQIVLREWAAYTSRITACSLLADAKTNKVESLYFDETETMGTQWWKLRKMEKEYYLQIVTGERDIDAFDEFVTKWYENGGETITQEVREAVH